MGETLLLRLAPQFVEADAELVNTYAGKLETTWWNENLAG